MECSLLSQFPHLSQETLPVGLSTSLLNIAGTSVAEITFEDSGAVIRPQSSFGSTIGASNFIKIKDSMDFSDFLSLIFSSNCEDNHVIRRSVAFQLLQSLISSRSLNTLRSNPTGSSPIALSESAETAGKYSCVLKLDTNSLLDNKQNGTCNLVMKHHNQNRNSQATSKTPCSPSTPPTTPAVGFGDDEAGTDCPIAANGVSITISGSCPNADDCSSTSKDAIGNSADNCSTVDTTDSSLKDQGVEEETIDSLETGESDEDEVHLSSGDQKEVVEPAAHDASSNEDEVHLSRNSHTGKGVAQPVARAASGESEEVSSKNTPEAPRYSNFMPPPLRPPPSAPLLDRPTSSSADVKVGNMKCPLNLPPPPTSGGGRAAASEGCAGVSLLPKAKQKSARKNVEQWNKMFGHVNFAKTLLPSANKPNESSPKRNSTLARGTSLASQRLIGPAQMLALQRPSVPSSRRLPTKQSLPSLVRSSSARPLPSPRLAAPRDTMQLPPCSSTGSAHRGKDMFQEELSSALIRQSSANAVRFRESSSGSKSKVDKSQHRPSGLYKLSISLLSAKDAMAPTKLHVWDVKSFPQAEQLTSIDHKIFQSIMKQFAEVRINAQRAVLQSIQNENMEIERLLKLSSSEEISQHLGSLVEHSVRLCSLIHNSNVRFSELDKPFKNPEDKNAKQARSSISAEHDHAHRPSHSDVRFRVWKLNRLHKDSVRILRAFPPRGVFTISKILKKNNIKTEETAFEVWKQKFGSCSIRTGSSKVLVLKFLHNGSIKKHHYRFESNDEVQQFFLYVKNYMEN